MKTNISHLLSCSVALGACVSVAQASSDYGPAVWRSSCNANYYTSGYGHKFHVIHDMEGYYASTISLFGSCGYTSASVHYLANGKQDASSDYPAGQISQMVTEAHYAWHVLCWNKYCTGTEHEGFASNPAWYTTAMYNSSADLSRHIATKFGFPKDRNHIVGHNEWKNSHWTSYAGSAFGINTGCNTHSDPGSYWDWSTYMNLINNTAASSDPTLKPCAIQYANGHELVFSTQDSAAAPWYAFNTGPGTSWSTGWLGDNGVQQAASDTVPVLNTNGYMEIFVVGQDAGYLRHRSNTGEGTAWGSWSTIDSAGYVGNPAAIVRPDGGCEVFVHAGNGGPISHFYHSGFTVPWSSDSLGGTIGSDATVIINANGYMEVFATDADGNLVHRWNTGPGTGWNSGGWVSLGSGAKGRPAAVVRADGGVEVFVRHSDDSMDHYYHGSFTTAWSSGNLGGTVASNPTALENNSGAMEVFAITSAGGLWHIKNSGPGTGWGSWAQVSTGGTALTSDPSAIKLSNGVVEVFARESSSKNAGHVWNNTDGTWSGWGSFGGPG